MHAETHLPTSTNPPTQAPKPTHDNMQVQVATFDNPLSHSALGFAVQVPAVPPILLNPPRSIDETTTHPSPTPHPVIDIHLQHHAREDVGRGLP